MKKNSSSALALISFAVVVFILCAAGASYITAGAKSTAKADVLSPGLYVIAENSGMAKSGLRGEKLSFNRDDFARALNLKEVSSITFTSVPPAEHGKILVGNTVIGDGHTVNGSNISLLSFTADSTELTKTSFSFRPDGAPYDIECTVYFLDKVNYAPSVSTASSVSLNVSTYEGIRHCGKLSAYDPDGDDCVFEIVSYPKDGIIVMNNAETGEYVYQPNGKYVGKDSFKYVVKDKYGNYSAAAEVSITVNRSSISSNFDDMKDSPAHSAAIKLTEKGIMSGTRVGENYYFQPEKAVSRSEFVVMAMQTLGIKSVNELRVTDFSDDADIPASMKGYIAAAYELNYINGSYRDGKLCFLPGESITRAEAAVIVGRMIEAATPVITPTFTDGESVPAWAQSAVYSLTSMGILDTVDGAVRATDIMSRADTARMLAAMMEIDR